MSTETQAPPRPKRWSTKRRPAAERFWEKVDAADCWEWTGCLTRNGYGNFYPEHGSDRKAHRYAWEMLVGPIPAGMTLDHLCKNRRCVNPDHLRVMPLKDNILHGHGPSAQNARKTHCRAGHPLSGDNLHIAKDGDRECLICRRARTRRTTERRALIREKTAAKRKGPPPNSWEASRTQNGPALEREDRLTG